MRIRLLTRWGSYLQGAIVSVSATRAAALVEAGYGKYVDQPMAETNPKPAKQSKNDKK
jgi:hypothetical protein